MKKLCEAVTASLAMWLLLVPAIAATQSGYTPPRSEERAVQTEISEESFGPFTVERRVIDRRSVPVMHVASIERTATLTWKDQNGFFEFSMVDNGMVIEMRLNPGVEGVGTCIFQPVLLPPNPQPSTADNWTPFISFIEQALEDCDFTDVDTHTAVRRDAEAATQFYGDAANAWKLVARELFGSISRRCVKTEVRRNSSFPMVECTQYLQAED